MIYHAKAKLSKAGKFVIKEANYYKSSTNTIYVSNTASKTIYDEATKKGFKFKPMTEAELKAYIVKSAGPGTTVTVEGFKQVYPPLPPPKPAPKKALPKKLPPAPRPLSFWDRVRLMFYLKGDDGTLEGDNEPIGDDFETL